MWILIILGSCSSRWRGMWRVQCPSSCSQLLGTKTMLKPSSRIQTYSFNQEFLISSWINLIIRWSMMSFNMTIRKLIQCTTNYTIKSCRARVQQGYLTTRYRDLMFIKMVGTTFRIEWTKIIRDNSEKLIKKQQKEWKMHKKGKNLSFSKMLWNTSKFKQSKWWKSVPLVLELRFQTKLASTTRRSVHAKVALFMKPKRDSLPRNRITCLL